MTTSSLRRFTVALLTLLISNILVVHTEAYAGFGEWQLRNPSGTSIGINSLTYGKGKYVGYSVEAGGLVYSKDMLAWEKADTHVWWAIDKIKIFNGVFYAIPVSGPAYSSTDGITWQEELIPYNHGKRIHDIAFGKSMLVVVGDEGVFVAEQGKSWTHIKSTSPLQLSEVAYGNGFFTAVGKNGTIQISQNGVDWTSVETSNKNDIVSVTFGNGTFVAVTDLSNRGNTNSEHGSEVLVSTDGTLWSSPLKISVYRVESVVWKNGRFWGMDGFNVLSSFDGYRWETVTKNNGNKLGELFDAGDKLVSSGIGLYTSEDGVNWDTVVSGRTNRLKSVTYAKGKFVAVGSQGTILTSPDGRKWEDHSIRDVDFADSLESIIEANGIFVTAGFNGSVFSSTSGNTWQKALLPKKGSFYKLAKGKDVIIAVGTEGTIFRSGDAKKWSVVETGIKGSITDVVFGNGIFVAYTQEGIMLISTDGGKAWRTYQFDKARKPLNICYGNGMFLLKTNENPNYSLSHLYSSEDGMTWQEVQYAESSLRYITSLAFVGGEFLATTSGNKILSSSNGREWFFTAVKIVGSGFNAITYGNNSYVAVGGSGRIIQSDAIR